VGRPRKKIDREQVERLAEIHCTMIEMGAVLGCSVDTLERRFADVIKEAQARGKASLRRCQYKAAVDGSPALMIWLGKQLLGQRDQSMIESKVDETSRRIQIPASDERWKGEGDG
jgi:hypothetical protein